MKKTNNQSNRRKSHLNRQKKSAKLSGRKRRNEGKKSRAESIRAKRSQVLPVVLSQGEVQRLFRFLEGDILLITRLLYGTGMRLGEALNLRIGDLDFDRNEILIRHAKGAKDRRVMVPESLKANLLRHINGVKLIHETDVNQGWGRVELPFSLDKKYPNGGKDRAWQWVFPQRSRWKNPETNQEGRHHRE